MSLSVEAFNNNFNTVAVSALYVSHNFIVQ